jgi:apolipoprotein N-acyltransferase
MKSPNRRHSALLLFSAGALMALGFAPYHVWTVIFISLPLFYLVLTNSTSYAQAAWRGFYFGYGHAIAGTWWIANALLVDAEKFAWLFPFSVLGLSAVMALWFVVFALLVHVFRARMGVLLFAILWVVVELARSFGMFGFPWNLLGYMSLASLSFAQAASLVGTYGLSFLLLLIGLLPVMWLGSSTIRQKLLLSAVCVSICSSVYFYGAARLQAPIEYTQTLLRLVQPNIAQSLKGSQAGQQAAVEVLARLSTQPAVPMPDVTIWPETSYPFTMRIDSPQALPAIKTLITGAVRAEGERDNLKLWNSIVALSQDGTVLAHYDKRQLVPFGEFVPLRKLLPLDKITPGAIDFSRGAGPKTLTLLGLPAFSPLVCYEGIFPSLAVDTLNRPEWLLNLTNDGWYGDTAGPYQHLSMVRMRAIEQGLPMVRAANSGVSAVWDSYGRVVGGLSLNQAGVVDVYLPAKIAPTSYARFGEFGLLGLLIAAWVVHNLAVKRR